MARKIFNIVYEIISTAVITVGILLAILYLCGIRLYHVKTGSMGEMLPAGGVCFVSTYSKYENVEVGDVISFRVNDEMFVTHRVEKITDAGFFTKGDENDDSDPEPVTKGDYIGKTIFALPYIGEMFIFFRSFSGKVIIVITAAVLLVLGRFYKRSETDEKIDPSV